MTKPINIYVQSRIEQELPFNRVGSHASGKNDNINNIKSHEITSLRVLVDNLMKYGASPDILYGFFYSYQIPQIGKEFDLLKFTESESLNIELKSQAVPLEQILTQLRKNRYYLGHLGTKNYFYTFVTDSLTSYKLSDDNTLIECDFAEIFEKVKAFGKSYISEIDDMFRASKFLVSPLRTPEKFINGEYFLTPAQDYIKNKIMRDCENSASGFFSLKGHAGTGKTLLLYDIAKEFSKNDRTLVIHCAKIPESIDLLNDSFENLHIVSAEAFFDLDRFKYILIDESHRLPVNLFYRICGSVDKKDKVCIFSTDAEQILSISELNNAIADKIDALNLIGKYELSERIRTNKEIDSFIKRLRNINRKADCPCNYSNISLAFGKTHEEAREIINLYKKDGYTFINLSKENDRSTYCDDLDAHSVIGCEFERVVMLLDSSFYYDEDGILNAGATLGLDFIPPNLLHQGITRVREKLALVVEENSALFDKITEILE